MKTIDEFKTELLEEFGTGDESLIRAVVNSTLEFSQRWIPCEEELPEYYKPVNIKRNDLETTAWRAWSEILGDVYTIAGTAVVLSEQITHWKPIELI